MMTRKNVLLLSACAALLLSACDEGSDAPTSDDMVGMSFYEEGPSSMAGSYLAARVAQNRFDWSRAEAFLSQTIKKQSDPELLGRRLMLLALGAGDMDTAEKYTQKLDRAKDKTGLSHFIDVIRLVRVQDFKSARIVLGQMPDNALSKFAAPLLGAWINAGDKTVKFDAPLLKGNGIYAYHRILIADFRGVVDDELARTAVASVRDTITPLSAEQLGDLFLRHKYFDTAAEFYKIGQKMNPNLKGIDTRLKAAADQNNTLPAPLVVSPAITSVTSGISIAFFDMASTFYNDESYESALVFARMSLGLSPDLQEAKLLIANVLARQNRLADAIAVYEKIPKTDLRYYAVQQKIASLRVEQGDDRAAIDTLTAMVATVTDEAQKIDYLMQIGDIHRENEDFDAALAAYDQAADAVGDAEKPEHWALYYARGMTLERLKKWERAEKDLKTALAFQPDHPYIMNYLGYSWADQGLNLDDAMKLLFRAVNIVPDDGYVTDSVGWAYYKMGKFPDAVTYLERAVELLPYDPTINDHLGDAYAKVGRMREAQFQWNRAINYGEDDAQKADIRKKLE